MILKIINQTQMDTLLDFRNKLDNLYDRYFDDSRVDDLDLRKEAQDYLINNNFVTTTSHGILINKENMSQDEHRVVYRVLKHTYNKGDSLA